jgi:Tol biopolymer transport system component
VVPGDWSPDGGSLAAVDFGEDGAIRILLVPVDGGEPLLVRALDWRAPNAVSFSPDGRFLAFDVPTSDESMERDLAVYDLQTGRELRILDHPANDLLLGWSPTGEIYFSSERAGLPGVWRVRMADGRATGEPELVKRDFLRAKPVGFTAAGDFFYAVRPSRDAVMYSVTLDAAGLPAGPARALTSLGDVERGFAVSHDGRLILYLSSDNLGARRDNEMGGVLLKVVAVDGGQTREFHLPLRMRGGGPGLWMPDASGLIFRGNEEGRYGVFRLDFESVGVERLISGGGLDGSAGGFRFDLTPDGGSIVYIEDTGDLSRLVVRSLANGSERTLVSGSGGSGPNVSPVVSPDGMWVAFYGFGVAGVGGVGPQGQVYDLMVVPLAGAEPRRIASTRGVLAWAADSKALLMNGPEITRIPLDGGPPVGLGIRGGLLWVDPAGRTMTFSVNEGGGPDQLWLMGTGALR